MDTVVCILVVEDDPDAQFVVGHMVERSKRAVVMTGSAQEALRILTEHPETYRAVVIDLELPGKDGWQLLREIRETPALHGLACIAITAYHRMNLREEVLRAGFNAYFPKPIDAPSFAAELDHLA